MSISLVSRLTLLTLVCHIHLTRGNGDVETWRLVATIGCADESAPVNSWKVRSDIECVAVAARLSGLLVAQFDSLTRQCSVFHFRFVCHLIVSPAYASSHMQQRCIAYVTESVVRFLALSRQLKQKFGDRLTAAWRLRDSEEESGSLVCGQTQMWQAQAVAFTEEGAEFHGSSSNLTLENVDFGDLSGGFTILLRFRRTSAKDQPLLENYNCDNTEVGIAVWEQSGRNMYYACHSQFSPNKAATTLSNSLPSDTSQFLSVAISAVPSSSSFNWFVNTGFVTTNVYTDSLGTRQSEYKCWRVGFRHGSSTRFEGVVQTVAIVNTSMTSAEISEFFGIL